ncbi:MAG: biotin--[acetyl-CoA-carboxylase] ligase, partial [Ferruginibacter sp.]
MKAADTLIHFLDQVDSTNNYAMALVRAGLSTHGQAYAARVQTAGKGQWGRNWATGIDENIALSIVLAPKTLKIHQQFHLSVAIALGCCDFFTQYAGDETTIKWPNDIYWRDRKAAGILIENVIGQEAFEEDDDPLSIEYWGQPAPSFESAWKFAVAGIGININQSQFDAGLKNPVSLKQITGKQYNIQHLVTELYQLIMARIRQLSTQPFENLLNAYNHKLYKRNATVMLKKG